MQATYLALARGDARPIAAALRSDPRFPPVPACASFVRNHDELTLDKLSDAERDEVFAAFGPDPDMQLYGRGLRRRLPTMLGGDQHWLRMAYCLMFALPGAPVLFYGEEIGMGENLAIEGRLAVRTPMQWTSGPAAGFTAAPADALCRPFPDGGFGPAAVNVAAQRATPTRSSTGSSASSGGGSRPRSGGGTSGWSTSATTLCSCWNTGGMTAPR